MSKLKLIVKIIVFVTIPAWIIPAVVVYAIGYMGYAIWSCVSEDIDYFFEEVPPCKTK